MSNRLQDLKSRVAAIRLDQKTIAERANLDKNTVGRTLNGTNDPLSSTLNAIEAVVAAEEARLTEHLSKITGDAA